MASVNKVILLGNLGADPEIKYMPSGDAIANLRIATTDKYKDRNGQMQEVTEWHSVAFFGKTAEICGQYLKKGSQIYVEGSLRTRKWQDKDGNDRYTTEIRGDRMQMLGGREPHGGDNRGSGQQRPEGGQAGNSSAGDYARESGRSAPAGKGGPASDQAGGGWNMDDDIPFASASVLDDPMTRRAMGLHRKIVR